MKTETAPTIEFYRNRKTGTIHAYAGPVDGTGVRSLCKRASADGDDRYDQYVSSDATWLWRNSDFCRSCAKKVPA